MPSSQEIPARSPQVGPYRLDEQIGRGGMGTVWRAWDERLKRHVAVKRLRPDVAASEGHRQLLREAQATARLNHPAVVHVYDLVEEDDGVWIVMEMVDGKTLRRLLEEQGPLPVPRAVQLGREIAEGLAEAHSHGILHRDLKVSNVMVTPSGHAKILDFGIAKELFKTDGDSSEESTATSPEALVGTHYAMSPEQIHGHPLDERSDLFSLGSLLYEILTGEAPFRGETPAATLARVLSFQPALLPKVRVEVSWELSLLVEKLLEKDRLRRPANAETVAATLATLGSTLHRPRKATPPPPPPPSGETTIVEMVPASLRDGWSSSPGSGRRLRGGEHRLLTVLCCGVAGLDEVSGQVRSLDLEAVPDAMDALRSLAQEVCREHSGTLGTVLEDRLLLYFGHPQAREDDAQRAVRAACALAARSGEIQIRAGFRAQGRLRPALRIALHTGPALALLRAGQEEQILTGSTLDTATEILSVAPAGEVVVSAASRLLIARAFATKLLTSVQVKGSGEILAVYRVLGAADPLQSDHEPLTPLVARERELELLVDRFRLARAGTGQAVMVSGEAGIGKSRLARALRERLASEAPVWWIAYGALATRNAPLAPVIGLLERNLTGGPAGGLNLRGLEEILSQRGLPLAETVPFLAPLLSLPVDGRYPSPGLNPEVTRQKTFEALVSLLTAVAERGPLVLVVEELQWIDSSTVELLRRLLDEIAAIPMLLVATFRPELQAPWSHRSDLTQLSLSRLTDGETAILIDRILDGRALPDGVRQQLLTLTDGVPLFAEEMTKAFLESAWTGEPEEVPATLVASLAARLDRTGLGKEVAQIASVLGRTFSFESLEAVSRLPEDELQEGLDRLIEAGLVHRRGAGRRAQYTFKHALVQDAAYNSLLSRDRQVLHLEVARTLEAGAAEPGLLAHHWSHAVDPGDPDPVLVRKAVSSLLAAAEGVRRLGVYRESHAHLDAALRLVRTLPAGADRDELDLAVETRRQRDLHFPQTAEPSRE